MVVPGVVVVVDDELVAVVIEFELSKPVVEFVAESVVVVVESLLSDEVFFEATGTKPA